MMLLLSQSPNRPQQPQTDSDFEVWRNYAARISNAIRERREDAYDDGAKTDTRAGKAVNRIIPTS